jgi:hypothetical protein
VDPGTDRVTVAEELEDLLVAFGDLREEAQTVHRRSEDVASAAYAIRSPARRVIVLLAGQSM